MDHYRLPYRKNLISHMRFIITVLENLPKTVFFKIIFLYYGPIL